MDSAKELKTNLLSISLLALFAFLVYSNSFQVPFILDDFYWIRHNSNIRMNDISCESVEKALEGSFIKRPLAKLSFALNYYFNKYDVAGYHWVNLTIHIFTGVFLFFLLRITLALAGGAKPDDQKFQQNSALIAFLTALVWIVHPVNTQSVTYIVQRMNSMAAMFYVLSILLYAKSRVLSRSTVPRNKPHKLKRIGYITGCLLSGIFAFASKENAITLPLVILIYEWFFFQNLSFSWLKKLIFWLLGFSVLLVIVSALSLGGNPLDKVYGSYIRSPSLQHFSIIERLITEFRVLVYYISLFFFPHPARLHIDYIYPLSQSLAAPVTTFLSIITHFFLLVLSVYNAKKHRIISFCILWFFITLAIESSLIGLAPIFEHRTYLPFMMLSLITVILFLTLVPARRLSIGMVCILALLCLTGTFQRNLVWQDRMLFWKDNLLKSPKNPRIYAKIGDFCFQNNQIHQAKSYYKKALSFKGDYLQAHMRLGNAYLELGNAKKALSHYEKARFIDPCRPDIPIELGNTYFQINNWQEALKWYDEALKIEPQSTYALYGKALALSRLDRPDAAIKHYQAVVALIPNNAEAHKNLADLYVKKQNFKHAIHHYKKALAVDPENAQIHYNIAITFSYINKLDACVQHLQTALKINPGYKWAQTALKQIQQKQKELQ